MGIPVDHARNGTTTFNFDSLTKLLRFALETAFFFYTLESLAYAAGGADAKLQTRSRHLLELEGWLGSSWSRKWTDFDFALCVTSFH